MYGKLFAQMFDGTLATRGPWQAMVTFQQMIILADKRGIVDMTPEAISRRTTIPLEIIKIGITALEQPDGESRTPAEDGKRIIRLSEEREWGWRIVNYEHYRAIRSQEERREYMRLYQQKRRAAVKPDVNKVNNVSNVNQSSKQYAVSSKQEARTLVADAPDWLPAKEWNDYKQHRREIGKPLKPTGESRALQQLERWHNEGKDIRSILDASVVNGWQGLFPDRKKTAVADSNKQAADEWLRRHNAG